MQHSTRGQNMQISTVDVKRCVTTLFPGSLIVGGGKMRDPGNEVGCVNLLTIMSCERNNRIKEWEVFRYRSACFSELQDTT